MRFASIGSGSAGNGLVVETGNTRILLDCGFGLKDTLTRLARLDLKAESLDAIIVTHEHEDHASGAFKLAAKLGIPVCLSHGTFKMIENTLPKQHHIQLNIICSHSAFEIKDLRITPFPVPHDAREPTQFVFHSHHHKLGVLTDTGCITPHIELMLNNCDALILECNHDRQMLADGPYPESLKKRVSGKLGHLDNQSSANLLTKINTSQLQHLVAAHLSHQNNRPELVKSALAEALKCDKNWIGIADQNTGSDWRVCR